MNNKCIYLKQKLNRKLECKKDKNKIVPKDCAGCPYKKAKAQKCCLNKNKMQNNNKMRLKSNKLAKLERNRTSLFTDDLEHCIICNKDKEHLHEVFPGAFRQRSMNQKMVLPLCSFHHAQIHKKIELSLYWKRLCQQKFEESHTRDEFIKIFGRSYL